MENIQMYDLFGLASMQWTMGFMQRGLMIQKQLSICMVLFASSSAQSMCTCEGNKHGSSSQQPAAVGSIASRDSHTAPSLSRVEASGWVGGG